MIKLTEVIAVWETLHVLDTGDLGFCDLEKALDEAVGVVNDICPFTPEEFTQLSLFEE